MLENLLILKLHHNNQEYVIDDKSEKKRIFNKGKKLAESSIINNPNSIELRYWYLVNLGSWAKVYGIFKAAREGVADIMREQSNEIILINQEYEDGGGYFMLGAVHYKSPYIPFLLSWPDNDDAIKFLTLAVETGNAELTQLNYLAQALYKDGQVIEAKELLNRVINTEPNFENLIEDLNYIQEAKDLLKDM